MSFLIVLRCSHSHKTVCAQSKAHSPLYKMSPKYIFWRQIKCTSLFKNISNRRATFYFAFRIEDYTIRISAQKRPRNAPIHFSQCPARWPKTTIPWLRQEPRWWFAWQSVSGAYIPHRSPAILSNPICLHRRLSFVEIILVSAAWTPAFLASLWEKCSHRPASQSSLRDGNFAI